MIKKLINRKEYKNIKIQIIQQIKNIISSYDEPIEGSDLIYKIKNNLTINLNNCDKYAIVQYLYSLHFDIEELLDETTLRDDFLQLVGEYILSSSPTLNKKWYSLLIRDDFINILKELNT
jgi:hypothetical protein